MPHWTVALLVGDTVIGNGMRHILDESDFRVSAEVFARAGQALDLAGTDPLDLVICDVSVLDNCMPVCAVFDAIKTQAPTAKLVIATDGGTEIPGDASSCAMADGFVDRTLDPDSFRWTIRLVMHGQIVLPCRLPLRLDRTSAAAGADIDNLAARGLSEREIDVLRRLGSGSSNKEIARAMRISDGTVRVHLRSVLRKIGAENRTQAAIWSVRHGLV